MNRPATEASLDAAWSALTGDLLAAMSDTAIGKYKPALHPRRIVEEHRAAIEAEARASLDVEQIVSAVRDWVQFGAGDGTDEAEHTGQHLLERIAAEYERLGRT